MRRLPSSSITRSQVSAPAATLAPPQTLPILLYYRHLPQRRLPLRRSTASSCPASWHLRLSEPRAPRPITSAEHPPTLRAVSSVRALPPSSPPCPSPQPRTLPAEPAEPGCCARRCLPTRRQPPCAPSRARHRARWCCCCVVMLMSMLMLTLRCHRSRLRPSPLARR